MRAGYASKGEKSMIVENASVQLDSLKCFLQIAWKLTLLDTPKYIAVASPLVGIGKMLGGWRKQASQEAPVQNGSFDFMK